KLATLSPEIGAAGEVRPHSGFVSPPGWFQEPPRCSDERFDSRIGEVRYPISPKTRCVRPRTLLEVAGSAAHRPIQRLCRTPRRKSRRCNDLCCTACGIFYRGFARVEGASIRWLL